MVDVDTRRELEKAAEKLKHLFEQREQIEVEIARQQRKVAAWAELCNDSAYTEALDLGLGGLSHACRTALRASRKGWMNTTEIMTALRELGFPLQKYKAPMASITTTVNRLVEAGEVDVNRRPNPGATEYKWIGQSWGAPSSLANMIVDHDRDKAAHQPEPYPPAKRPTRRIKLED